MTYSAKEFKSGDRVFVGDYATGTVCGSAQPDGTYLVSVDFGNGYLIRPEDLELIQPEELQCQP